MQAKPGDIIPVKIGSLNIDTVIDEHGTQRLPINPIYDKLFECGVLDLNKLAVSYAQGEFPYEYYLDIYLNIGYSVSGFSSLSAFQHLEIDNPLWEK